jgi:hypothetical protein
VTRMKDIVTTGFTIRVMTTLCVSMLMASCGGDEPVYREISNASTAGAEPQVTVVEWYPRPKHMPAPAQTYGVYPPGQQALVPQPPMTWQAESQAGVRQPVRPAPEYVYRDIPSDGSWGQVYGSQQPGVQDGQYLQPRQQYMPRPWGETPRDNGRRKRSADPARNRGGPVQQDAWQAGYPGYGYGVYPGYGYVAPGWGGW